MKNILYFALIFFLGLFLSCAESTKFSKEGWRIGVDLQKESLFIENDELGLVLCDIHLKANVDDEFVILTGWQLDNNGDKLVIHTGKPTHMEWEFDITTRAIQVHASADNAFITAIAPAPKNRMPARVADPGRMRSFLSNEDYTGTGFHERAYLPPQSGHVMYLALGFVDASNIHALFDKQTNTVIQFPDDSRLIRNSDNQALMEIRVPVSNDIVLLKLTPEYYTRVLGMPNYVPYDDTYHQTAPTGWNHWLAFFRQVTEQDIVDHADWVAANLKDYGMAHIQLDDGFDHEEHRHWYKDWDPVTFPHGPEWLANYIKSRGFIPGLWTVPYSYCIEHGDPEWFLRDRNGNIAMDYQGGGELDFSHPDVIRDYWRPLLTTLKSQGWEYYKFDMGSTVEMWQRYEDQFYDTTMSSYDVSRMSLEIFREIMGPEIWHTNHPDNWGGRMGLVDVVGCGRDPGPGWRRMNNFFEVISNNTYQNHIVWYSDPDCIVLRGKPTRADATRSNTGFLTLEEARTATSLLSITGLQFLSGDDLINLRTERVELIKKTIPIMPIFPIDLFGRGRAPEYYPDTFDLKVNKASGIYDVIAVTNWENKPVVRSISFEGDLALDPRHSYLVFDYWKEQLIGQIEDGFQMEIPPHGTRVFLIRRRQERPQLLATNRHITGAFSIKTQQWYTAKSTLSGTSETVLDALYKLFIYVPGNVTAAAVAANADNLAHKIGPNGLLEVSFTGQKEPVAWTIKFSE